MTAGRGKLPISLVVITANEERNLQRCLTSADFCADVVVVDSGSTDRTVQIAMEHGARVFHRAWSGYGPQKNFGCDQASQPWVLCLDADEEVSPQLRESIHTSFASDPTEDGFEINRHSIYGSRLINHSGWYPQWRLFLFRRDCAVWGGPEPHAEVLFNGKRKARLAGDLYHHTYRDIHQHAMKTIGLSHAAARAMYAEGRRASWLDILFRPMWAVLRSYVLQRGFLSGFYGLVIAMVSGAYTFLKYTMLREMHFKQSKRDS